MKNFNIYYLYDCLLKVFTYPKRLLKKGLYRIEYIFIERVKIKIFENLKELTINNPVLKVPEFQGNFMIGTGSDLFKRIVLNKEYEPKLAKLCLKYLNQDKDVLDIGANLGFYSVLCAKNLNKGRVIAIEPTPNALKNLYMNIKLNDMVNKIEVYEGAITNSIGKVKINIVEEKEEYSSIGVMLEPNIINNKFISIEVNCTTIDELVKDRMLLPGFIKIDVEGMEHLVFEGASTVLKINRPIIFSEIIDYLLKKNGSSAKSLLNLLESYDYVVLNENEKVISPKVNIIENSILCVPKELYFI